MSLLTLAVIFCMWRLLRVRGGGGWALRWPDWMAAAGLFVCCCPAVAWLFVATLEKQFPVEPFPRGDADAIVALGGALYRSNGAHVQAEPGFATYIRSSHAAWLYHHWKQVPVVTSGGRTVTGAPPLAEVMRRQLIEQGVPDAMIWVEDQSSTTYTNAVDTARILRPRGIRRIVLVTEAFHMLRAERCFRKQGFDVLPAPCWYRTLESRPWLDYFLPQNWAIQVNQEALHEWLGLGWYRLRGEI